LAKENLKDEKIKAEKQYDRRTYTKTFKAGNKILLYDETLRRGRSKKTRRFMDRTIHNN